MNVRANERSDQFRSNFKAWAIENKIYNHELYGPAGTFVLTAEWNISERLAGDLRVSPQKFGASAILSDSDGLNVTIRVNRKLEFKTDEDRNFRTAPPSKTVYINDPKDLKAALNELKDWIYRVTEIATADGRYTFIVPGTQ